MIRFVRSCAIVCLFSAISMAQTPVDPSQRYERIIAVTPLVGAGTYEDPKRPLFAPKTPDSDGILAFSYELTDDGRFAIVEFVSRSRAVLSKIASDPRLSRSFDRQKDKRDDVEAELKKLKKGFDLSKFGARVQ